MKSNKYYIKENVVRRPPVSLGWLLAALGAAAAALGAAMLVELALPAPLTRDAAPPDRFIAQIAHEHLVNLTSIGPRVAGSYENEVLAVGVIVEAVKRIAREAAPHVRVELDVQTASGAFPLSFMDGMNHVYSDVSNVVARVSAAGGSTRPARRNALLLNCHIDTVPDSPGASDDGAGCAVLLETMRALAATRSPPRHDAVFLFNAAEENVLQGSHGFITQHKWAKSVRAFINIEACGAGGREVLFQAGPNDPWIVEIYAGAVPHPFASSLAQELFESGLIPADTDFRIFRDFGKLSGVDLAWSANGYVYHTALDTAQRVSRAVLQRTGDNVLALTHGMLASESLESEVDGAVRQPVFFDVMGLLVLSARAPAALLAAAAALVLVVLDVHLTAKRAAKELFISHGAWWACVGRGAACWLAAQGAGLGVAAALALLLHAAHARITFYSRAWLLAPLYAMPAIAAAWMVALALSRRWLRVGGRGGWWAAHALQQGGVACASAALVGCVLCGLRSGFLPWLWAALPAAAGCAHALAGGRRVPAGWWAVGAVLPALQTWYLALGSLRMLVPMMGRAGEGLVPPDVIIAVLTAALALGACCWLLPLVVSAESPWKPIAALSVACMCACALALSGDASAPYALDSPQRLMVFHTRRTLHDVSTGRDVTESFYWVPKVDVNTPHSVDMYAEEIRLARRVSPAECAQWLYCGMPYYLPVLSLVPASHRGPAREPPRTRLHATLATTNVNETHAHLQIHMTGPAHIVLIVSPAPGARVVWSSAVEAPLAGPTGGPREVYFFALHSARPQPAGAALKLLIQRDRGEPGASAVSGTQLSLAGHSMFGADKLTDEHARLLGKMPRWVAPTGWGVDLHLYQL